MSPEVKGVWVTLGSVPRSGLPGEADPGFSMPWFTRPDL